CFRLCCIWCWCITLRRIFLVRLRSWFIFAIPIHDTSLSRFVWTEFNVNRITRQYTDSMISHFSSGNRIHIERKLMYPNSIPPWSEVSHNLTLHYHALVFSHSALHL